jgi:UDP-glucose 4-epimerase
VAGGVQRLVYFSTINVYGPTPGSCADEHTPPEPHGIYAETKLAGEEAVLAAKESRSGGALGIVLRMAAIYGPRMKGNYPRLVKALSRGWFIPVGDGENRRTLIYEQDVVRAALLAAEHPRAPGRIYNVSDGELHSLREVIACISAALGRRPPQFFLPTRPARWAAGAADGLARLAGHSLNLTTTVDKFVEDIAVRAERIQRDLAFQPLYGLREGWQQTIAAWQKGESCSKVTAP